MSPTWTRTELGQLEPILQRVEQDLQPLEGCHILVLCSRAGEVAFRLAKHVGPKGHVMGVERSRTLLGQARAQAQTWTKAGPVGFRSARERRLAFPSEVFDALVSEFVIYPTPLPTQIGQPEMARVLKPGGIMIVTDVVVTRPLSLAQRRALRQIGVNYLCEAQLTDFRDWMRETGLERIEVVDMTPTVREVWLQRQLHDRRANHRAGYDLLFKDQVTRLGRGIFYVYAKGVKPPA